MRTYCRNYDITREDIFSALAEWKKSKGGRKKSTRLINKYGSETALVESLYAEIKERRLTFDPIQYIQHWDATADEGHGKWRMLGIQSSKQQVVDYLIVGLLKPMFNAHFDYYQCAAIKGKGQRFAVRSVNKFAQRYNYAIKQDTKHFFQSVDADKLKAKLAHYVGSEDVLYCLNTCLDVYGGGLDIGSHMSQYLANWIMSFACRHINSLHTSRRGTTRKMVKAQVWHMDDCLLFGNSKRDLKTAARSVAAYLKREFGLTIKPWKVSNLKRGDVVKMAGYTYKKDERIKINSATFIRARRSFKRMARSPCLKRARRCVAYWGRFKTARLYAYMHGLRRVFKSCKKWTKGQKYGNTAHTIHYAIG